REIDDEIRRIIESAHQRARDMLTEHREALETTSRILLKRETIERNEFLALLDGKSEEDVFGPDDAPAPPTDDTPEGATEAERVTPRPTTLPGLAGGTLEARGLDLPEKPEPA
ncbi:MAG: cell division protein FtsH, partial [Solirubrobacteraceae bacterium]|nr:cell division protein FtsH [Solirubrobacteraceae bacterium]